LSMEPVLTKNIVLRTGTTWLDDYEANGGYQSLSKVIKMSPKDVIKEVSDSGLRGRGGAGFPTGMKWGSVLPLADDGLPRYIVCNFDEMEPGTFKDRYLVEGDPHQLLEGLLVAGYACQASVGYIFIRLEYKKITQILRKAIHEAEAKGYIGKNIQGSGWSFEIHIHTSAGRYVAGEETGLLTALEGKPANPRSKPPYPGTSGAWGRPTVVQNVETLSCVPHIFGNGAEWFKSLGNEGEAGTKIYGVSGKVKNPGCWEMPMGSTLREIIEGKAGGMREGYAFRAALPGGASTRFMDESQLDVSLGFDSMKKLGLFSGTGTAIVVDDKTCPVAVCQNLEKFFARESCGWCTPCREGLPWLEGILRGLEAGQGQAGDVDMLIELATNIGPNTYCALAMGAVQPLLSALDMFRKEFDEHIRLGKCPYAHE